MSKSSSKDRLIREIEQRDARIATLKTALAQERARAAVWRDAALNLYADLDALYHGGPWPQEVRGSAAAVLGAETSPAVTALLELAEAAAEPQSGGVDGILPARQRIWVSRRLAAALDRWKEIRYGAV